MIPRWARIGRSLAVRFRFQTCAFVIESRGCHSIHGVDRQDQHQATASALISTNWRALPKDDRPGGRLRARHHTAAEYPHTQSPLVSFARRIDRVTENLSGRRRRTTTSYSGRCGERIRWANRAVLWLNYHESIIPSHVSTH
jgi:hypothetical protein